MGRFLDLTGHRYGELTVISLSEHKIKNRPAWLCKCDCGELVTIGSSFLRSGENKTCGKHKTKYFMSVIGLNGKKNAIYPEEYNSKSRLHSVWKAMLARCNNKKHVAFDRYGGIGIKVCDSWQTYSNFITWAVESGYKSDLTLDRIDNYRGYSPENCRWATTLEQARNKKRIVTLEAFGEIKRLVDWADDKRCVVSKATLRKRINAGHNAEFSITASESDARRAGRLIVADTNKTTRILQCH